MRPIKTGIIQKAYSTLLEIGIKKGSRIIIGVSGGPDSTGLLFALSELKSDFKITLFASYLDHGLRPESEIEEEIGFLKGCCARIGISLSTGKIEHGTIEREARLAKRSIEELAREKRYAFFHSLKEEHDAGYIATGHTLDDVIETVIMRFFQGSDYIVLGGIKAARGCIIRPLIHCSKKEIEEYLTSIKIDYRIDSSNLDTRFLRNKTRQYLVPAIKSVFPGFIKNIEAIRKKADLLKDFIESEESAYSGWEKAEGGYRINIKDFEAKHPYMRMFSFLRMYDNMQREMQADRWRRLPFRFLSRLLDTEGRQIRFRGHGIRVETTGGYLFCRINIVESRKKGYLIAVEKNKIYTLHSINKTIEVKSGSGRKSSPNEVFALNEELIAYPLVVRSKRPGDCIMVEGFRKSIKKLFNDWKVKQRLRFSIPVIEDRKRILAVIGEPFGYQNRYAERKDRAERPHGDDVGENNLRILFNNREEEIVHEF